MKILTLNTWQERGPWRERWEIIFKGLKTHQPDVVILQEIFNPDWIKEIARRNGYASAVYYEPESGLAIFSHYPLVTSGSKTLGAQSSHEDYRRFVLFGQFKMAEGNFCVFNTHLSWMLEDGAIRERQVCEISEFMDEKSGTLESVIGGDFNSVAWSPEIRWLTQEKKFADVYRQVYPNDAGLTWTYDNFYTREGHHALPDRRIDYLFARHGGPLMSQPVRAEIIFGEPDAHGVFASDHYGVFAEFK